MDRDPTLKEIISLAQLLKSDINQVLDLWNEDRERLFDFYRNYKHSPLKAKVRKNKLGLGEEILNRHGADGVMDVIKFFLDQFEVNTAEMADGDRKFVYVEVIHPASNILLGSDVNYHEGESRKDLEPQIEGLVKELKMALIEQILLNKNNEK